MGKVEKKILAWLEEHLALLAVIALVIAGMAVRLPLMDFLSSDSEFFLLPWYEEIREQGLRKQVGNYNLVYQMLIFLMTRLPVEPLHAYKYLSIVFDYLLAFSAASAVWRAAREDRLWKSVYAMGAVLLSPAVFLNSAGWAQCDAIYVFFCVSAIVAMMRERYRLSMIMMGLAFSFKLQAVFLMPFMLFVYFQKRKFSFLEFLWIPAVMFLTGLPAAFFGRDPLSAFTIYLEQTTAYPSMSMNYPSVWLLLVSARNEQQYEWMYKSAIVVTVCVLAVFMLLWIRSKVEAKGTNLLYMAFLLVYSCVLFLPGMHERYGYLYEIAAIVIACICPATVPLCAGLIGVTMCTYGTYLFRIQGVALAWLCVINVGIYLGYAVMLSKRMLAKETG